MFAGYNGSDVSDDDAFTQAILLSKKGKQENEYMIYVSERAPSYMCCPLTKLLFMDPVSVIHGNTYEREAIERWFEYCQTDPLTGEHLFITAVFEDEQMALRCSNHRLRCRLPK